ncbi:coiled-coil domain-containing protein 13 isoform X10 [Taeniopygia guttata]|uniref:coiled-coil domain-containing protein 13 isoform X10 n=1 Tax=Taeniopygia guttata TaxID=59729 RepID=UPI003BB9A76F
MEPDGKVNEDFKSQFKAYQEQQQRRLQNLKEMKKEKQDRQKDTGSTKETIRALSDLNLFKKGPPVNEDASKSLLEAENEQLQDQLREVRDENCRLYRLVSEKDFEIKELQKRVREERLALSGVSGLAGDVAATKIVELAKKNREVTAEFESERAKVKQLNHKVKELERELQAATEKIHSLGGDAAGIKESTLKMLEGNLAENPEVKALQEKLSTANVKVTEYRNQLQNLKQELKLTQKILAKEVGEDVNIQNLMANSGNWRGRAQQILLLQTKVQELEHKLSHQKIRASLLELDEGLLAFPDPRKLSVQEKNLLKIRSLEKEKKESLESQQKQMQEILKGLSQKEDGNKGSQEMMGQHLEPEIQKKGTLIDELSKLVVDRETKVQMLEKEIGQLVLQDESGAAHPPCSEHSGSPEGSGSSRAGRTESACTVSAMGHVLVESAATEPFFLIPPGRSGNQALCACASLRSAGTDSSSREALLGQIKRQSALCQAAKAERKKLLELVAVLEKRVEEISNNILETEKKLQEEEWQSDSLEQQLENLQVDAGSSTSAQELALRSRKGEGEPSAPATSPISPLAFIDSDKIRAPPAKPSPGLELARGDGTCSEPGARQQEKSWPFFSEKGFPTALSGSRIFAACFHGITPGKNLSPAPCCPQLPLHSSLRDSAEG